jgi:glycine/serine hydroxymethyltransferase
VADIAHIAGPVAGGVHPSPVGQAEQPQFRHYAAQIVTNAKRLAQVLAERGFDLVSGGTDNHLLLIDLSDKGVEGKPAAQGLDRAGLVTNHNTVPYDPRKPFDRSSIRLGTPSVTSRGMGPAEMELIGRWIDEGIQAVKVQDDATPSPTASRLRSPPPWAIAGRKGRARPARHGRGRVPAA